MYIRYLLKNVSKIRITDDSSSQNEQSETLSYIPGSTVRGVVINRLALTPQFDKLKTGLFSDQVRYLNAYPVIHIDDREEEMIPSLKGFYESKEITEGKKQIENVVADGEITPVNKRAGIGKNCCRSDNVLFYMSPELGSDLRINIGYQENEKKNMFRSSYLVPGQLFCGYIEVRDENLLRSICTIFEDKKWYLGNSRTSGYGECQIVKMELTDEIPYGKYLPDGDRLGHVYLYLASNTAMRSEEGEYTGIDVKALEKKLGVEDLKIAFCSTSTVLVRGYNRIWNSKTPCVPMYEMGSVFKLEFRGTLKKEKIDALCRDGIGVRRNEGFGNVLILDRYEQIQYKQKADFKKTVDSVNSELTEEEKQVLRIAAKGYYKDCLEQAKMQYLVENTFPGQKLPSSQLGTIRSYIQKLMYQPLEAKEKLLAYLDHAVEKDETTKKHTNRLKRVSVAGFIRNVLDSAPETLLNPYLQRYIGESYVKNQEVMGIPVNQLLAEDEKMKFQLQLLISMIQLDNRKGIEE